MQLTEYVGDARFLVCAGDAPLANAGPLARRNQSSKRHVLKRCSHVLLNTAQAGWVQAGWVGWAARGGEPAGCFELRLLIAAPLSFSLCVLELGVLTQTQPRETQWSAPVHTLCNITLHDLHCSTYVADNCTVRTGSYSIIANTANGGASPRRMGELRGSAKPPRLALPALRCPQLRATQGPGATGEGIIYLVEPGPPAACSDLGEGGRSRGSPPGEASPVGQNSARSL